MNRSINENERNVKNNLIFLLFFDIILLNVMEGDVFL